MIPTKQVGQKSKVAVYVRVRPATKEEQSEPTVLRVDRSQKAIFVRDQPQPAQQEAAGGSASDWDGARTAGQAAAHLAPEKEFHFSDVLPPDADQTEVYDVVARANVDAIFEGHFSTIMAYGQTGTGKTYTLASRTTPPSAAAGAAAGAGEGTANAAGKGKGSEGIITRALQHIFDRIGRDEGHEYTVALEFIQIYKEVVNDLLRMDNRDLQIREDHERGVFLNGVTSIKVRTVEEALAVFDEGARHRASALTSMNAESSRSHACFVLNVQRRKKLTAADVEGCGKGHTVARGRLTIVDLAGSERLKKTNAKGAQKQEAQSINLSLSCLGNVVHALTDPRTAHIPYRDSKLTRLLQESLGGCGKTSIIICVSPSATHVGETVSTLLFGQRAACVEQSEVSHMEMDWKALAYQLQAQLEQAHLYIQYLKERTGGADGPKRRHGATPRKLKAPPPPLIAMAPEFAMSISGMGAPAARLDSGGRQQSKRTHQSHPQQARRPQQQQEDCTASMAGIPADFLMRSPALHAATPAATTPRSLRPWNSPAPHRSLSARAEMERVERDAAQLLLMTSPSLVAAAHAQAQAQAQHHNQHQHQQMQRTPSATTPAAAAATGGQRSASRLPLQQVVNSPPPPLMLPKGMGGGVPVLMPPAAAASLAALGAPKSVPRSRNAAAAAAAAKRSSAASSASGVPARQPIGSARDPLVRRSLFGAFAGSGHHQSNTQAQATQRKRPAEGSRPPPSLAKRARM